jgi:hypothetical protein
MWSDQGKVAPTQVGATLNEQKNGPAAGQPVNSAAEFARRWSTRGRLLPAGRQYCGTKDP